MITAGWSVLLSAQTTNTITAIWDVTTFNTNVEVVTVIYCRVMLVFHDLMTYVLYAET